MRGLVLGADLIALRSVAPTAIFWRLTVRRLFWTNSDVTSTLRTSLARTSGLEAADRRAVTLEVAFQNVALAIGLAVAFFPELAGVAFTSIFWGVVHLTIGFAVAAMWTRVPIAENSVSI